MATHKIRRKLLRLLTAPLRKVALAAAFMFLVGAAPTGAFATGTTVNAGTTQTSTSSTDYYTIDATDSNTYKIIFTSTGSAYAGHDPIASVTDTGSSAVTITINPGVILGDGTHAAVTATGSGTSTIAIDNSGTINGAVTLGSGSDTFTNNSGGSVTGTINMGSGSNAYYADGGAATSVVGGGTGTFVIGAEASALAYSASNYTLTQGTASTSFSGFSTLQIAQGIQVTASSVDLNSGAITTVDNYGTLTGAWTLNGDSQFYIEKGSSVLGTVTVGNDEGILGFGKDATLSDYVGTNGAFNGFKDIGVGKGATLTVDTVSLKGATSGTTNTLRHLDAENGNIVVVAPNANTSVLTLEDKAKETYGAYDTAPSIGIYGNSVLTLKSADLTVPTSSTSGITNGVEIGGAADSSYADTVTTLDLGTHTLTGDTVSLGTANLGTDNTAATIVDVTITPNATTGYIGTGTGGAISGSTVTVADNVIIVPTFTSRVNVSATATENEYTIISATDSLSSAATLYGATSSDSGTTWIKDSGLLKETLTNDNNGKEVTLTVAERDSATLASEGINAADAGAMQTAFANDSTMLTKLYSLNSAQTRQAVKEAHPEANEETTSAVMSANGAAQGVVAGHLLAARESGTAFADNAAGTSVTGLSAGGNVLGWNVWMQGFGSSGSESAHGGADGYDSSTGGITFGLDKVIIPDLRLGLAYTYMDTNINVKDSPNKNDIESSLLTLYGQYLFGRGMYVDGHVTYGWNNYDSHRYMTVLGQEAHASYDGDSINVGGEFGRDFAVTGAVTLTPYLGLDYTHVETDSYTESDAGSSDLHVGSQDINAATTTLGGRAAMKMGQFTPSVHVAWVHDWAGERISTNADFANGGGVLSGDSVKPDYDKFNGGVGLKWQASDAFSMDLVGDYLGSDHLENWSGALKLSYKF